MKRLIAALTLALMAWPAMAQNTTGLVVPACGSTTPLYLAGRYGGVTIDVNGNLCTGGSIPGTAPTTAPTSTSIIGGVYNLTPPTVTSGQAVPLQTDNDGSLRVILVETLSGTLTDKSGTITLGGTAQQLMAANTARKGWLVQNNSAGTLWINEIGGTAVQAQPSLSITAGSLYTSPTPGASNAAISIVGATTSQAFTAREW
jgi:hypothetical protein